MCRQVVFEPRDKVWVHICKKKNFTQRRSKLLPRSDGHFQILECINDNAHKLDLHDKYNISATFNIIESRFKDKSFSREGE